MHSCLPRASSTPSVLLLVPFDTGRSYFFRARGDSDVYWQWAEVFGRNSADEEWDLTQFPKRFRKPLNWTATLCIDPATCPDRLKLPVKALQRTIPGKIVDKIRVVFFPLGLAIMVIRAELTGAIEEAVEDYRGVRNNLKPICCTIVNYCAGRYIDRMKSAVIREQALRSTFWNKEDNRRVLFLKFLKRTTRIKNIEYLFPVFSVGSSPIGMLRRSGPDEAPIAYDKALVYVGWNRAFIRHHDLKPIESVALQEAIEVNFVIALVSWYSLVMMDQLASLTALNTMFGEAGSTAGPEKVDSGTLRLAFMEAANASHPIRWTTHNRDLVLLEQIHKRWSSERWWKNVNRRTQLLALHHQEIEAEGGAQRSFLFAIFGSIIGSFTLASAIADVLHLWAGKSVADLPKWVIRYPWFLDLGRYVLRYDWLLVIAIPVALGVFLFVRYVLPTLRMYKQLAGRANRSWVARILRRPWRTEEIVKRIS